MNFTNKQLIIDFYNIGAIKFGEFTLKSGVSSPIYLDLRQIVSYPIILSRVATQLLELTQECSFDLLCGVPYTALPIATAMSLQRQVPMILRRKEKKSYGTQQQIEGVYKKNQTCLIIEDVITSGGSVLETADDLRAHDLTVKDVAVLIDRKQGGKENLLAHRYTVHALMTLSDILHCLTNNTLVSKAEQTIISTLLNEHTS